ncbi:hypothetical protein F5878DRAFT_46349 [Lentinula raphanica]|uniref:Uncharacterized protein n=1 Tax=Lentinula raphanica TaxID=153919 RepID=A0AA38UGF1_9AGAR|nr:hypothetical protein F5878DRAFT_46349 [Lentinula raphanica]
MLFPVEILDIILSFIDDIHSYSNLALSSSILLRRSRPLHFQSITIKPTNANKLSEVLASPYQTILGNIREIHLVTGQMCLEQHDLLRLIASLNGQTVRSMILDYYLPPDCHAYCYKSFLSEFPNLLSIKIDSGSFPSVTRVMYIICSFRFLHIACLNNDVEWGLSYDTPDTTALRYNIPSSLRKLTLGYWRKRDILECFMSCDTLPAISELDLGMIMQPDAEASGRFLRRLGSSLTSLSLGFYFVDGCGGAEDFDLICDLSMNTHLQSITFQRFPALVKPFPELDIFDPWPWISKIICSMRSPDLTTIAFSLPEPNPYAPSTSPYSIKCEWAEIDKFFGQGLPMLPGFKTLQFCAWQYKPDSDSECDHHILELACLLAMIQKELLPWCDEIGLLEFMTQKL